MAETKPSDKLGINARIAQFFLRRTRLTAMLLMLLVVLGSLSIVSLRTSGFPSPKLDLLIVQTVYPGASAQTVQETVTKPIEGEIKSISGVKSYSSTSSNNSSTISVVANPDVAVDSLSGKIDGAVKSLKLPDGAEKPTIFTPKVSSDEYYFAVVPRNGQADLARAYQVTKLLQREIEKDTAVAAVNFSNTFEKQYTVSLDPAKLAAAGLSPSDVTSQLQGFGLQIPVTDNAELNGKETNILLSTGGASVTDLRNLTILSPSKPGSVVALRDLGTIQDTYTYEEPNLSWVGYRQNGEQRFAQGVIFSIDVADGENLGTYDERLQALLKKYFDQSSSEYQALPQETKQQLEGYETVTAFDTAADNREQVKEIKTGLFGRDWNLGPIGWVGYLFGGIQLVFVIMLLLVSWRAAILSALAIPLSFFFSTILIWLTGNELNTLVLFSLVLVIGLVVDPALVVLEVIQRKVDAGLKGTKAVLAAINEIGGGLFMAVLCSTLVFVPFGVVSGVFGEIISYIPLTVIPAILASYVVPLVFLAPVARRFLRRRPGAKTAEEENLWPAARWMMRTNKKILHSAKWKRSLIVISALIVPVLIAQVMIGTGALKIVQFAKSKEANYLILTTIPYPQRTAEQRRQDTEAVVQAVMKSSEVRYVTPLQEFATSPSENTYVIGLTDLNERKISAEEINNGITGRLKESSIQNRFFEITSGVAGAGPSTSNFPISIGIKTENLTTQESVSKDLGTILTQVCKEGSSYVVKADCPTDQKAVARVDNGFDSRPVTFVEVKLDPAKTAAIPVQPLAVRQTLASLYGLNDGKKVTTVNDTGEDLDVVVKLAVPQPTTIEALAATPVPTLTGQAVALGSVANISQVPSLGSITRVKGETVGVVKAKPTGDVNDQQTNAMIQKAAIDAFKKDYASKYRDVVVENYSEGDVASIAKSFTELGLALLLAILLIYLSLVIFFNSLLQPLIILFAIPLTFIGVFPALAFVGGSQFGFLEIIGLIILVGLVVNVAIFLMDLANHKVRDGWDDKEAITYASGIRFRPIILTKLTALFSLTPLAVFAPFYRSLAVVVMFGLLTSGFLSLFVSPIMYIAFRRLSEKVRRRFHMPEHH